MWTVRSRKIIKSIRTPIKHREILSVKQTGQQSERNGKIENM